MISVISLTHHAAQDDLSEEDYREIYQEVRGYDEATGNYRISLDNFVDAYVGAYPTKPTWSKWHNHKLKLNRAMRNQLRVAVGLPRLPMSVQEALADIDEDAEIVQIGDDEVAHRVIKLQTRQRLVIHVNGAVLAEAQDDTVTDAVTEVTSNVYRRRYRPELPEECRPLVDAIREQNLDFAEVLQAGINTLRILGAL